MTKLNFNPSDDSDSNNNNDDDTISMYEQCALQTTVLANIITLLDSVEDTTQIHIDGVTAHMRELGAPEVEIVLATETFRNLIGTGIVISHVLIENMINKNTRSVFYLN
jgi:hypothetical protein